MSNRRVLLGAALALMLAGCGSSNESFAVLPSQGAAADRYESFGNVLLEVPQAEGVLVNDLGGGSVVAGTATTNLGGEVELSADGSFFYRPPLNQTGVDSFVYSLSGGSEAVVSIDLSRMVVFVDPAAPAGGSGYQDDPVSDLASALATSDGSRIVYLLAQPGQPPISTDLTLPSGAILWGEGAPLATNRTLLARGDYPTLSGRLTLSGGNQVRGLELRGSTSPAIGGTGVEGTVIADCRFLELAGAAVNLVGTSGDLEFTGNLFEDDATLDPGAAVTLETLQSTRLVYQNNRVTSPDPAAGYDVGLRVVAAGSAALVVQVDDNEISSQRRGIALDLVESTSLEAEIRANTIAGCQTDGVSVVAGVGERAQVRSQLSISNNRFQSLSGPAVALRTAGDSQSSHSWDVRDNVVSTSANFGLTLVRNLDAVVTATLADNTISGAAQAAISVSSGTSAVDFQVPLGGEDHLTITGNRLSGGLAGLLVNLEALTITSDIQGNTSEARVEIQARAPDASLALGGNQIGSKLEVVVPDGFTLNYEDRGQTTPVPTFLGPGAVRER